jgi:lipopolysaccharide assembly protein A
MDHWEKIEMKKMSVKLILVVILTSLAAIFLVQNVAAVDVRFLFWKLAISRALLIFFSLAAGFILGWFCRSYFSFRRPKSN